MLAIACIESLGKYPPNQMMDYCKYFQFLDQAKSINNIFEERPFAKANPSTSLKRQLYLRKELENV